MKGLVLKDLFCVGHNAKSMAFVALMYAVLFIPTSGAAGYTVMCALLFSMMIATTFTFDDQCKWTRYAVTLPVTRREIVAAKFVTLAIFCTMSIAVSAVIGWIGSMILGEAAEALLLTALVAWGLAYLHGGLSILLTIRFGTERARMVLIGALAILGAAGGAVYGLFRLLELSEGQMAVILGCLPVAAILIGAGLFRISARIFSKQAL